MSKQQNLRYEAQKFQELLLEVISDSNNNNTINDIDNKYLKISNVIEFIENAISPFLQNQEKYDNTVFVMGPTGAGKSTLMNYIADNELFFKLYNDKPGIFPEENKAIAYVGRGEGSTTLAPNIWHANTNEFPNTTFIDCAGDFDSGGSIIEIINSKIKTIIAQNVNNAKILIVSSQDSIGASGSYGVLFKEGLEKSAQFLNDITYFNESMAFVVSHAGRIPSTPKTVESCLNTAIKEPKLEKYKQSLEKIIANGNFTTFSKYSDEVEENSLYLPPNWNANQREKIIDVINKIQFQKIPSNFFNNSSSSEVREQMSKAFEIVKIKAGESLKLSFEKALSHKLVIYAAALKPFVNFVEKFLIYKKCETGLMEYINNVNKFQFFKLMPSKELPKLAKEIEFLSAFTKVQSSSSGNGSVKIDWNSLVNTSQLFRDIVDEAKSIILRHDDFFSYFCDGKKISTKGCFETSPKIKDQIEVLCKAYKNKASIEQNKYAEKYYYFEKEKKIVGTKKEDYTESMPYTLSKSYNEQVPYQEIENYTDKILLNRNDQAPPLCPGHDYYGNWVGSRWPVEEQIKQWQELLMAWGWEKENDGRFRLYEYIPKQRLIIKEKTVTKYHNVIEYQNVTKQKDIPDWQEVEVKKYNEQKYNGDINNTNDTISQTRNQIIELLKEFKSANVQLKLNQPLKFLEKLEKHAQIECKETKINYDPIKNLSKDLYEEWKYLEFEAMIFKLQKPTSEHEISLQIQEIEINNLHENNFLANSDNNFIWSILGNNEEHHIDFN